MYKGGVAQAFGSLIKVALEAERDAKFSPGWPLSLTGRQMNEGKRKRIQRKKKRPSESFHVLEAVMCSSVLSNNSSSNRMEVQFEISSLVHL